MKELKRVIIDTDPGIDDALAIILALKSPELKIEGITTVSGNVPSSMAAKNVLRILHLMDKNFPPVAEGSASPLKESSVWAHHVHGEDGLGNLDFWDDFEIPKSAAFPDAVSLMLETAQWLSSELTLITLGPLTNLARAVQRDENTIKKIKEVIMMGGAVFTEGNVTPDAEFNIFFDPHAAKIVFESGIPITLVGLDVTNQCVLKRDVLLQKKKTEDRLNAFLYGIIEKYLDFYHEKRGLDFCHLHDPLAVAVDPTLVATEEMSIDVSLDEKRGKTSRKDRNTSPIKVCTGVDRERFEKLFLERVFEACPR
jgi:inosine-uridine nucleoside N-ribohydrolase